VGSHRLSNSALALAEMVYLQGFSVVSISSALNWEFMEKAATVSVPGYTPRDARDVYEAMNSIYLDLNRRYPNRFTSTAFVGISLGGLHGLYLADLEARHQTKALHFDRIVAVNPPVDMIYALHQLDDYYNAPLAWAPQDRKANMDNTLLKASWYVKNRFSPGIKLPFDEIESKYLIGLNYQLILRQIIFASQERENLGVVQARFGGKRRQPTYDRLDNFSYADYYRLFVLPYYQNRLHPGVPREELLNKANLRSIENELRQDPKIRVFINKNDFVLSDQDIQWLQATLDGRATVFPDGGHLGNLYQADVQARIMESLADLKTK
jgi:pimeloyl-ACP methyl ester carboxylesterase